ncbi:MAG: hypothetical protein WD599_07300 [Balneolaceae bacterium]
MKMKKAILLSLFVMFGFSAMAEAQFRENVSQSSDYMGAVIKSDQSSQVGDWMNMLNMTMDHSYSMNFSNIGGQFQNLNAYTNHMTFGLSEDLTGRLDISFLHSPFGNSFMSSGFDNLGSRIVIDRAQLDYQISPNANVSIEFSQRPYHYSPFGSYYPGTFSGRNYFGY